MFDCIGEERELSELIAATVEVFQISKIRQASNSVAIAVECMKRGWKGWETRKFVAVTHEVFKFRRKSVDSSNSVRITYEHDEVFRKIVFFYLRYHV
jgi:hypothetical protein